MTQPIYPFVYYSNGLLSMFVWTLMDTTALPQSLMRSSCHLRPVVRRSMGDPQAVSHHQTAGSNQSIPVKHTECSVSTASPKRRINCRRHASFFWLTPWRSLLRGPATHPGPQAAGPGHRAETKEGPKWILQPSQCERKWSMLWIFSTWTGESRAGGWEHSFHENALVSRSFIC